jgi:hypothetical protein
MTPEELDAIGVDEAMVEKIQLAVNGYYGQFEEPAPAENAAEAAPAESAAAPDGESAEVAKEAAEEPAVEPSIEPAIEQAVEEGSVRIENTEHPGA